jgi:RNA polymerase sigma-70 factor (ECF subfamily)
MTVIDERARWAGPAAPSESLAALYDRHAPEVYRFLYRRCGDADLAEDLAQDTFLVAAGAIDDPAELTVAWLMRVARNRLIDVIRRQSRFETKLQLVGLAADEEDGAEIVADRLRVRDALRTLKVEYRLVLLLHYVDGLPVVELADEMGRSVAAVESLVRRARRSLARALEGTYG